MCPHTAIHVTHVHIHKAEILGETLVSCKVIPSLTTYPHLYAPTHYKLTTMDTYRAVCVCMCVCVCVCVSAEGASTCRAVINIIELERERRTAHPARIFYHTPCHAPIISNPLLF